MPGLYLHIPFCKQACHYCNFHFSTSTQYRDRMVRALIRELELQQDYLGGQALSSIYLGGGTPSLLTMSQLMELFEAIYRLFPVEDSPEITLEANPDDLTPEYVKQIRQSPVNRFSIGIQSFRQEDLLWMNRAHSARESMRCIPLCQDAGFEQLTIDLIYGVPGMDMTAWQQNINKALVFKLPHLSCYCLTVEPGTALAHFVKKGTARPVDEERASEQFLWLMDRMETAGMLHYEISNFALPGKEARHNSSYWKGEPYLGIGPSAHSFDGQWIRQWNVAHNGRYMAALEKGEIPFEKERLSRFDRYNEWVMTGLRTSWGVSFDSLRAIDEQLADWFLTQVTPFLQMELVGEKEGSYFLSKAGKLQADHIASELFWVE